LTKVRRIQINAVATVTVLALALAACGSSSKRATPSTSAGSGGSINVLAASSLTKAFTALASGFEAAHNGSKVKLNFASSSTLAEQIQNGAPADVFASADQKNMQKLQDAGSVTGAPVVFAKNQMEIAVAPGNPGHITKVADLAQPGLIVVLCASEAPCGKYADQLLSQDHVTLTPKSREIDAKSTLTKVQTGDADAAIVYVTDVKGAAGKVDGVAIPTGQNVVATLPIAALKDSSNAALAKAWVDFVTSSANEKTLQDQYGFLAP
jgi:molybdate transport system substrate-binding protein